MNLFKLFWSNPSGGVGGWLWRMVAGQGPERKCTDITGTEVACGGSLTCDCLVWLATALSASLSLFIFLAGGSSSSSYHLVSVEESNKLSLKHFSVCQPKTERFAISYDSSSFLHFLVLILLNFTKNFRNDSTLSLFSSREIKLPSSPTKHLNSLKQSSQSFLSSRRYDTALFAEGDLNFLTFWPISHCRRLCSCCSSFSFCCSFFSLFSASYLARHVKHQTFLWLLKPFL